jgi:hypothetical protein
MLEFFISSVDVHHDKVVVFLVRPNGEALIQRD